LLIFYRNPNSNKVSLLNKLKQENSKLSSEVNELRKNLDYLEKTFNLKLNCSSKTKLSPMDFATLMNNKEIEVNECRRILHNSVIRIKTIFENHQDDFSSTLTESMKNFLEGKTLEEKFQFYLEKLFKFLDVSLYFVFYIL
jgi:uncharacterized protein (DUF342 family)